MLPPAEIFRLMADRIERNPDEFGGALLVIPPDGEAIDFLAISPRPDMAAFWATAKAKIEIADRDFQENERAKQQGGWRR